MGRFQIGTLKRFLKGKYSTINMIVETGTCLGNGTLVMAKNFDHVITIELDKELQEKAKQRLMNEGYRNIDYINDDSRVVIKSVVRRLQQPAVFFLDAHWSGDETVDWENSDWKGYGVNTAHSGTSLTPNSKEQVPLEEETWAIANDFDYHGIIYIDDVDSFDSKGRGLKNVSFIGQDWSCVNLNTLKKQIGNRLRDWVQIDEQLIIVFDKKARTRIHNVLYSFYAIIIVSIKMKTRKTIRLIKSWAYKLRTHLKP